jgi:sulfite reductase (ferredoxin)
LGICLARAAARACAGALEEGGVARATLDELRFHINGCSNACGQQPIAPIGCFGAAQRGADGLVPSYTISIGGSCGGQGARFGTAVGKVPAAALPAFVLELAADFELGRRPSEGFPDYCGRLGASHFEELARRHAAIPAREQHPEFYRDLGAEEDFSLAGRGAGECGAGVFEVIQQELAAARKAAAPFEVLLPAARALLITRGVDAQDADTVLREFERHFVETGLVAGEFRTLLTRARGYAQGWQAALDGQASAVARLLERVELLYTTLDANLEFHPPERGATAAPAAAAEPAALPGGAAAEIDLRGVACPMNFVKAKLRLEAMNVGDALAIVLDDGDPIRNVPASFKAEGQDVGAPADLGDGHWRVVVRKKT